MPLSATAQQAMIVLEVGDTTDGRLTANVAAIWDDYADKAQLDSRLQVLYTRLRCIMLACGAERGKVDYEQLRVLTVKESQAPRYLLELLADTRAQILAFETKARGRRIPAAAVPLTTTEIVAPPQPWQADANDLRYKGNPYEPTSDLFSPTNLRP